MKRLALSAVVIVLFLSLPSLAHAQGAWPLESEWMPLTRSGVGLGDPLTDVGTASMEIVGDATYPAAFVFNGVGAICDLDLCGDVFFVRIRTDENPEAALGVLSSVGWGLLIDTDGDLSDYEYLMMAHGIGGSEVLFVENTVATEVGDSADSPEGATTLYPWLNTANDRWGRVLMADTSLNGTQDYFIDFCIQASDLWDAGASFIHPLTFWVVSTSSATSITADLGGYDGITGPATLPLSASDPVILESDPAPSTGLTVNRDTGAASRPPAKFVGLYGGPFVPNQTEFIVENHNDSPLSFTVNPSETWVVSTPSSGTVPPFATTTVSVSLSNDALSLGVGIYEATINFVNVTDHDGDTSRAARLTVNECDGDVDCTTPGFPVCNVGAIPTICVECLADADCDDSDVCSGAESCGTDLLCQAGTAPVCDDGDACNGAETCDSELGCQAGTPPDCGDGDACTVDSCDPTTGCINDDSSATCDDGDPCTADSCDPAVGCVNDQDSAACPDGGSCTGDNCEVSGCGCSGAGDPRSNSAPALLVFLAFLALLGLRRPADHDHAT